MLTKRTFFHQNTFSPLKTQQFKSVITLENSNCEELNNSKCDGAQKSNCDETQKLKL